MPILTAQDKALKRRGPHYRLALQHDAPFQALTTTRCPIPGPHYNTTSHFRPSLKHKAPLRPSLQHDAPLHALTTTRRPIAGPHNNTTPHCRPSQQHDTPSQALTTTGHPIAGPHNNTTPNCMPLLQHDAPLQALTTIRQEIRTHRHGIKFQTTHILKKLLWTTHLSAGTASRMDSASE